MTDETTRISISNHKGGVGKTTMTAHLGAALANAGHDVLLVDCDPQGTLSMHLTLNKEGLKHFVEQGTLEYEKRDGTLMFPVRRPEGTDYMINLQQRLPSIYEAFYNRKDVDNISLRLISDSKSEYEQYAEMRGIEPGPVGENIIAPTTDGADIIPANRQMQGLEQVLAGESDGVFRLKRLLDGAEGYDYVLIDTPATVGVLKDGALVASTNVVIPMQAETTSVTATRQHLEDVEDMEREDTFDLDMDVLAIVPNEVRDDGEAKNVTNIIRKQIPDSYWHAKGRSKPDDFSPESLPEEFWRGDLYDDTGGLHDGIPQELASFWNEMGCRPLITDTRDYTNRVVPFDIRTRVAIRRAYSANRTLYTHDEPCDMKQHFDHLADIIHSRTGGD